MKQDTKIIHVATTGDRRAEASLEMECTRVQRGTTGEKVEADLGRSSFTVFCYTSTSLRKTADRWNAKKAV